MPQRIAISGVRPKAHAAQQAVSESLAAGSHGRGQEDDVPAGDCGSYCVLTFWLPSMQDCLTLGIFVLMALETLLAFQVAKYWHTGKSPSGVCVVNMPKLFKLNHNSCFSNRSDSFLKAQFLLVV